MMNEEISETLVEETPPDKSPGFPLIGIGASAGGLNAIQVLFDNMPDDTGMAFVIIQHLSPDFKSMMVELLSRHTGMQIITVQDGVRVRPNCVYLMPASKSMTIQEGRLHLQNKDRSMPLDLPIDLFFNSLGNECAHQAVGVILSGTGTDGSRGIKTIKEQGGMIMVQSPESAQFDGMPVSSIATGLADYVLGPEEMPAELIDYFQRKPDDLSGSLIAGRQETRSVLQQILALIKYQEDVDFTLYKNETILRRLEKCMNIRHISSLEAYLDYLKKYPDEVRFLYREMLIGVTSFFRDAEAWDHLESEVIPALFKDKNALETVRVWVVGCSTGEEAYSLAILLNEYIQKNKLSNDFKIFATDIDKQAIDFASAGIYHEHVVGEFNSNRFKRYFTETEGRYQISKSIRERIVFARHNVIKDPPFIRMDMITCRNLLIYIAPTVQKKIILSFEFSLKRGGYLFLGSSESLGDISKDFHTINRKWKIYVLNEKVDRPVPIVTDPERRQLPLFQRRYEPRREEHIGYQDVFSEILIERYAPSCLIINEDFEVLYLTGGVDAFLNFPRKRMNVNLLNMVNEELSLTIRNAVRRASRDEDTLIYNNVPVMYRGEKQNAVISVSSFMDHRDHRRLILIEFALEQKSESPPTNVIIDDYMIADEARKRIDNLETELTGTRQELQATVEELETSNEELQASNEELLASNEELQSTNEELQSVNEELYSVNSELQAKSLELQEMNDDMTNLLDSTEIATIFLDLDCNIRKFTPPVKEIFNVDINDLGRPIDHFTHKLNDNNLMSDMRQVVQTGISLHREVTTQDGERSFMMRYSPFRNSDRVVGGVVLSLIDITERRQSEAELHKAYAQLEMHKAALDESAMVTIADAQGNIIYANAKFCDRTGYSMEELQGQNHRIVNSGFHPREFWLDLWSTITSGHVWHGEIRNRARNGDYYWIQTTIEPFLDDTGAPYQYLSIRFDVTERKQAQSHLMETRQNLETAMQAKDQFLATMSHEIRTPLNSIVGFTHLLLESQPTEDQEQMLRTLQFSTTNLLALINDILDYEKIEANRIDLMELHISITGMLEDLHRGFEFEAEDKGIQLLLEVSPEIPAVRGDPVRITQVLTNLIGNAIKFTDEGHVRIEARVVRETIDRVLLEIAISDTGIGINPHDVELIFERFTQLNRGGDHERGGSGLGLTITRRLLELYGSELKVDSSPGRGSRFYFQLDLQKSTQRPDAGMPDRQAPPIQNYLGARILLVEDNEINIMVARRYIQNWGLHCVVARNGEEALQAVAADHFDLILMDLRMPGIDGYETTRRIKEDETYRSIPVIALTANVLVDTRQRALECGMVDYVCKPFDPVDLQQKIAIALESVREV